jgi:tRNA nucleotidyltransferase/poly(A) polymerase
MRLKKLNEWTSLNEGNRSLKLNIPSDVKKIHKLFKKNKKQLYIVGGAVRDTILGQRPKDFDLATDALPEEVIKIIKSGGFKIAKEVGESFAIIFVATPSGEYEIATFREDIGKGRRPDSVKFSTIEKDVLRRDLTINALFYDIDKEEIVDLVGGVLDLEGKKIRSVGSSVERFEEDALRKLRALRFAARIGGKLDKEVHDALITDNSLPEVSPQRIREELKGGIEKSKNPIEFLDLINQYSFWDNTFPKVQINKKFVKTNNWIVQLAELLKPNDMKSISEYMKVSLGYSNEEMNAIEFMHFLLGFDPETQLMEGINKKEKKGVNLKDALLFAKLNKINKKYVIGLFGHKITTKGNDPLMKGLRGSEIGDKIKQIEYTKFKSKYLS